MISWRVQLRGQDSLLRGIMSLALEISAINVDSMIVLEVDAERRIPVVGTCAGVRRMV